MANFIVVLFCSILVIGDCSSIHPSIFETNSHELCQVTNELYWKLIQWFYGPLKYVDVHILIETDTSIAMNHLAEVFLKEIAERLNVKVSHRVLNTHFDHENVTYSELYSWRGEKFEKRPNEHRNLIYRKRRDVGDEAPKTFAKRRYEPEAGIFVIVEDISIIFDYLVGTPRRPFRFPRQIFVIAVTVFGPNTESISRQVLEKLWFDYGIANVIITSPCFGDPEITRTYFPFRQVNATSWGLHKSLNWQDINYDSSAIFRKFDNLHGFPLRVTLFRRYPTSLQANELPAPFVGSYLVKGSWRSDGYNGIDGIMLANAAQALNFTTVNIPQLGIDFGYQLPNGTFVGSIGDVLHSKVTASFNGRFMTDYGTNDIEYMAPYYFDKLCVIAPKAQKIPEWMAIFKCFSEIVWISLLVINCICGLFWFFLKKTNVAVSKRGNRKRSLEKRKSSHRFVNVFIEMWIIMLSGPTIHLPTLSKERIFMATCLISSLIVAGSFQGSLTTSFSTDTYYKDINTLEELDESGLRIGTSSGSLRNLFGFPNGSALTQSLASKYLFLNTTTPTIQRTAYDRDICCIERLTDISVIIANQYEKPDGTVLLHVIRQCPRSYFMAYIMKRGSPLLPTFSNLIQRLFEGGIIELWYRHVEYALITHKRYHHMDAISEEAKAFTMVDMQTAFYILSIGLVLSLIVFICELYFHRRKQEKPFQFVH